MAHNGLMAERKKPKSDRHKPSRNIRLSERLCEVLDGLAERNDTNLTQEVHRAVREMLAREGLWPPPR